MDKLGKPSLDLVELVKAVEANENVNPLQRQTIAFATGVQKRAETNFVHFIRHGFCLKCQLEATVRIVMNMLDNAEYVSDLVDSFQKIRFGLEYHLKEIWLVTFLISQLEPQENQAIAVLKEVYKDMEVEEDREYFYDINQYFNISLR